MKIKYRLSLAICSILVLLGSILSASTSYIVNEKMEKNLTNYLNEIMRSTREVIKYNIATDNSLAKEQVLKDQAEYISNYISLNYKCKVDIRDINGEIYWSNIEEYNNKITESLEQTKNGQAIVNLVSTGNGDYKTSIKIQQGKDEVTILSNEFIKMKEKIGEQINTIKVEKDKVEKLANSRKHFFDNVTHEIKTPLTAITGYAEMLKDNIVEDEKFKKKVIERIYYESERLNTLVLDLINVSKGLSSLKEEKTVIKMDELIFAVGCDKKTVGVNQGNKKVVVTSEENIRDTKEQNNKNTIEDQDTSNKKVAKVNSTNQTKKNNANKIKVEPKVEPAVQTQAQAIIDTKVDPAVKNPEKPVVEKTVEPAVEEHEKPVEQESVEKPAAEESTKPADNGVCQNTTESTIKNEIGTVKNIYLSDDKMYIDVDMVEFYRGEQAAQEAEKDGRDHLSSNAIYSIE